MTRPKSAAAERVRIVLSAVLVAVLVFAVYSQVRSHRFLSYDDEGYITKNRVVREGLTAAGIAKVLTDTHTGHWHPLTYVSHMADVSLFGLDPAGHHLVNVLFHAANAVLLFLLLARMTGAPWRSLFVAALFAVHPLHVESVAWAAERKDVLSTFFGMLTIAAYLRYAGRPSRSGSLAVALLFALGLLSKPMLVTLPLTLLLLDFWPLGRFFRSSAARLVIEKLPLFLLSIASSAATIAAAGREGALVPAEGIALASRLGNAAVSAATYLGKTAWPHRLAVFYPYPDGGPESWKVAAAALLLAAVTVLALARISRRPFLAFGWFWFLVTLLPVSGIVQAGAQSMADRYTYVPLIGPFVAVAWGASGLARSRRIRGVLVVELAAGAICVLSLLSWFQVRHWRDSAALFAHAAESVPGNYLAEMNLGVALERDGRSAEAIAHYREALRMRPRYPEALYNLGVALARTGRAEEAESCYRRLTVMAPGFATSYVNLGMLMDVRGKTDEALELYRRALAIRPDHPLAHNNIGSILGRRGQIAEAEYHFREALRLDPGNPLARSNLDLVSEMRRRTDETGRGRR